MDSNIGVRITADPSGVGPGVAETKAQLGGLDGVVSSLNTAFASMGAKMRDAFMGGAASANQLTGAVEKTTVAANESAAAFGRMSERVHLGGLSFGFMEKAAGPLMEALIGVFAVDKIGEFVNKMAEASEHIEHLSQQFGMTTSQVQQLQGVATATGIPIDALTKGMGLLDRNMANAAMGAKNTQQALRAVGVSLNDGRNQMQKLETVADHFSHMADGPRKAALAMQLFGRSGRDLIPILDLGSAGIEQLNQKMNEYGVVNADAVEKGVALAESTNETKLGFMGIWNVLTDALAPAFKLIVDGVNEMIAAFIQSYESGGLVAILFETVAAAIKIAVDVIEMFGSIFAAVWDAVSSIVSDFASLFVSVFGGAIGGSLNTAEAELNGFKDLCVVIADAVKIFVTEVKTGFEIVAEVVMMAADVATQALLSVFGKGDVQAAWNRGMNQLVQTVHAGAVQIQKDAADMANAMKAAAEGKDVHPGSGGIKLPKFQGGGEEFDPTGPVKKAKTKKPQDDRLNQWKEQLADLLNEEQNWGVDEQQFSLNFWQNKLDTEKLSEKQRTEIKRTMAAERKAIFKEEQAAEIESIKTTESVALDGAKTQTALQKNALEEQLSDINQKEKLGQLSATKAVAERNAVNKQMLQLDMQEADEEYQAKLRALQEQLALEHLKPDERKKINDQIIVLQKQHEDQMLQMNAQFNAKIKQQNDDLVNAYIAKWKGVASSITGPLGSMFDGMITKQQTFRQSAIQAADSIVSHWISKGFEMLSNWIATKIGMRAADSAAAAQSATTQATTDATKLVSAQTTNAGQVMSEAAVASAGAFAATAAIPIVGPELAPGAAAAAYGAVMGMAPLAYAAGGYDIPSGVNPLTQLHQEEMVLPAHLANPLRDMLSQPFMLRAMDAGARAGRNAGESGRQSMIDNSRGDVHLHHSPTYPSPGKEVTMDSLLKNEGDRLLRFVKKAHRDGKFN